MTKFIVVKKQHILKFCSIIFILCLSIYICYLFINKDAPTFSITKFFFQNETKDDFNGDGLIDSILIEKDQSTYIINVKCEDNTYLLKSKEYDENFLDLSPSHSIQIKSIDLSRDGVPEIIISGVKNNTPSTYIFKWVKDDFQEIFFSNKNIFGILDSNNSRTPKLMHTSSSKGDTETQSYVYTGNYLKDISYSKPKILSLSVIQKFIDTIELTYEISDAPDLFTPSIQSTELAILWNLDKPILTYSFQDGYFYDVSWDDNGNPTSLIWILSFNKFNTSNSNNTELILHVKVQINQFGEYKISSINKMV